MYAQRRRLLVARIHIVVALLVLPSCGTETAAVPFAAPHVERVVGYFPQWGVYERDYHVKSLHTSGTAARLTHLDYAFGKVVDGRCAVSDAYADYGRAYAAESSVDGTSDASGNFGQLRRLKRMYPHLKVLWAFGGWNQSAGFTQAARDPRAFAESCHRLVEDPRWADVFDGIDIDWEYPNACGRVCDTSGRAAFGTVLGELRRVFGDRAVVTAAIPAGEEQLAATAYAEASAHVDWFNVMTYDYVAGRAHGPTAPHSSLSDASATFARLAGIPAEKLLLGIGFYGRGWTGVGQEQPGGTATGLAPGRFEDGVEDYRVLRESCPANGEVDGTAFAHCGDTWWSYDTPATVAGKVTWARSRRLGGVCVWELSGDTASGELISAISPSRSPH